MNKYHPSPTIKSKAKQIEEPIPVMYILYKPHSNGLLEYLSTSFITHPVHTNSTIPIIINMLPHVKVGDCTPVKATKTFKKRII